ncbi:FAD-dependent oxidoreductase [Desulfolutivibrio sulfoxidireducens]|uniref:FAD-dependent oxidoreductase n=1 Tax=Desulfolutivibrio sulfoxidireducens TaxID=2773299 RepID=UPI00159E0478|nr:FAD-dependent oxidoreductase [Desulfolutivibrio sulfoxidireducens]QLA16040.1 pyridine nucleotide-disulfide oxidoreductase [Desulfolutivibrio sulfoxidireducens]
MPQHVLIIGAVALGPKAASRFKRLEPDSTVTMIDKDTRISYGGCGIPYFVSGDVSATSDLTTTSYHMVRDIPFFRDIKGVEVKTGVEAMAIDRAAKTVRVTDLASGQKDVLSYDKLVIATGAAPRVLPVPGYDLPGVHVVANLEAAESIRAAVTAGGVEKAVVIGAGFVGLEMAEALADMWDVETSVVEAGPRILMNNLGPALSAMALRHITDKGLTVHLSETVTAIEGDGRVQRVITDKRVIEADLVVMAAGVVPNSDLAARAGLAVSGRGGIVVDRNMRTSDPDIFAGGDCVEIKHLVTGKPFFLPMGSMANRQGRVIGDNLAGGASVFTGAAGSFAIKLFERAASGTGLTLEQAGREGLDAISALVVQLDRAHFYPGKELMTLELVVERGSRRVLGIQGLAASGDALVGRVGAVAAMMPFSPTVSDISNLEYPYSPPYASAMDVINTVGNVADNLLAGRNVGISPEQFAALWEGGQCHFLDCRERSDAASLLERFPGKWHNIPQGHLAGRLDEVPRDCDVVLVCNTGARSYEAYTTLAHDGRTNVKNLFGGMAALRALGLDPK